MRHNLKADYVSGESDYAFASRVLQKIGKKGNSWVDLFLIVRRVEKMDDFERMVFIALPEKQIKKCLKRWAWEYEKGFKTGYKVVGVDETAGYNKG